MTRHETRFEVIVGDGNPTPELDAIFATIPLDASEAQGIAIVAAAVSAAWEAGERWAVDFIRDYIHERVVAHDLRYRNGLETP